MSETTTKLDFTPEERRVIETRFQAFVQAQQVIAELRGITGNAQLAPDRSGFIVTTIEPPK